MENKGEASPFRRDIPPHEDNIGPPFEPENLDELNAFLQDALVIVDDLDHCNTELTEAGRPDLKITDRLPMPPAGNPEEVISVDFNNFAHGFLVQTGFVETGEMDLHGQPIKEPIPVKDQELDEMRALPHIQNDDELLSLIDADQYPGLSVFNHTHRAAFLRMLVLFPDFTKKLIFSISNPENKRQFKHFKNELFVAYQLMSRLVDKNDKGALKEDGSVNDWHLKG